jgi:hypothetical protein
MTMEHWSVTVRLDDIPETGRRVVLEANEAARAAVAKAAKVDAIETLSATFDLTRRGRDGLRAVGAVRARVRQTCVLSLEPVINTVEETIDVTFALPRAPKAGVGLGLEDVPAVSEEEPPEPLIDGAVDLGALATEFLILGIDPYPRKPGVAFAPPATPDAPGHPFAALAALKKASKVKD